MGNTMAMMALGRIYEMGFGVEPSIENAYVYFDMAAKQREPYAIYWLGKAHEQYHLPPDFMQNEGDYSGQKFLGDDVNGSARQGNQNYSKAYQCYKRAADEEIKEAIFKLGEFSEKGIEMDQNYHIAIKKYDEAAAFGHERAMNALGLLFYHEFNDPFQAVEWFKKAADKGCERALYNLGICYEMGHGVEIDTDQAFLLYKESADKGYVPAIQNLAIAFLKKANQTHSEQQYKNA